MRHGKSRQGWASRGKAGRGEAGQARQARQGRRGEAWQGTTLQGRRGGARSGVVRRGVARRGKAGGARHGRAGQGTAGRGRVGRGKARLGRQGCLLSFLERNDMKVEKIRWKTNANTGGVKAEDAYNAIEAVRKKNGGQVSPNDLLAVAKRKTHILHSIFEWNDDEAAKQHRLTQARTLLRSIEVVYDELPERPMRSHEIVQAKKRGDDKSQTLYSTTDLAMADPVARDALIATAIRQAMAFRRRFQNLRELQLIFEAIDKVADKVGDESADVVRSVEREA